MSLSPQAIIHPGAQLGEGVRVDPFVTIEEETVIGDRTWIKSHAHINAGTHIGNDCTIFQGAVVGGDSQDLKYEGGATFLHIGNNVTIREYCTINRATGPDQSTRIEDGCLLMAYVHIAHDCHIQKGAIIANAVNVAGHVEVGEHAIVGGMTAVQQYVIIGRHSYVAGGTLIRKDIPPYIRVAREPVSYIGVNKVGLERRNFSKSQITYLQNIYRHLFVHNKNISKALKNVNSNFVDNPFVQEIIDFIDSSPNGIIRGYRIEDV